MCNVYGQSRLWEHQEVSDWLQSLEALWEHRPGLIRSKCGQENAA